MISSYPSIFRGLAIILFGSCQSYNNQAEQEIYHGTIAYPFVSTQKPLGKDQPADKFIIRSASYDSEYIVEIPDSAEGYNIEIPFDGNGSPEQYAAHSRQGYTKKPAGPWMGSKFHLDPSKAVATDTELRGEFPKPDKTDPQMAAFIEDKQNLSEKQGPGNGPSYILGINRVNEFYKQKNFEFALVEVNNLLTYYPNSPKLYMMKGTLHLKLAQQSLALKAWERAYHLDGSSPALVKGIELLRKKVNNEAPLDN